MRKDPVLQRLVVAGNLMAERLRQLADELDGQSGAHPQRRERQLAETWDQLVEQLRKEGRVGRRGP